MTILVVFMLFVLLVSAQGFGLNFRTKNGRTSIARTVTSSVRLESSAASVCLNEPCTPFKLLDLRGGNVNKIKEHALGAVAAFTPFVHVTSALERLPLFGTKLLLQLGLSIVSISAWLIPFTSKKFQKNEFLLGVANSFSAGIFLMLSFSHLLPEAAEGFELAGHGMNKAFMWALGGYMAMFILEKIIFDPHQLLHDAEAGGGSGPGSGHSHGPAARIPARTAKLLVAAMSMHSMFETAALGLSPDKKNAALMAASIAIHQPAESVALLVALLKTDMSRGSIVRWLGMYSSIGVLSTIVSASLSKFATPTVDAIVTALTAGTFLYVGATEVIGEEFEDVSGKVKWTKFAALLSGMAAIFAVTKVTSRFHGH